MEIDGDRLNSISSLSPLIPLFSLSPRYADGDRWCGAPGLGPCRLIIDQEDRDGSRGEEDTEGCGGEVEKWEDSEEFMFQEWGWQNEGRRRVRTWAR